jgi:hypothetical protein
MRNLTVWHRAATAVAVVVSFVIFATGATAATLPSTGERKCSGKLAKLTAKLSTTVTKELGRCRQADVSGSAVGTCPNAGNTSKIQAIAAKVVAAAEKSCNSVCALSQDVECISNRLCPPLASGVNEACSAGTRNLPFDMANIGFPGPYCEAVVGGPLFKSTDIGTCASAIAGQAGEALIANLYGSLTNASNASPSAVGCLASANKAAQKLTKIVAKGVAKCRAGIDKGATIGDPRRCASTDPKAVSKSATAEQKLRDAIAGSCTVADLTELDLCGAGVGGVSTVLDAQNCLSAAAREVADSAEVPASRLYSAVSIIDAAYPPPATCGDNRVNQLPNKYLLLGEECDGTDDGNCPGFCLPPGDLFECTCGDRPRMRAFADGPTTDSDAGWTGNSFGQQVADKSGYIMDLSNCNCGAFTDADCTGGSSDPVCDLSGIQTPFCSWDSSKSIRCDQAGTSGPGRPWGNNRDENVDCAICDSFSVNAGVSCKDSTECQSQCYDGAGSPTGPCNQQSDCASGQVCRGRCDDTEYCIITPNGAPLPVAAAGAQVCNVQLFREGVTGTRNLVTGENETYFKLFSITHLGENNSRPCPVCGGFCVGGTQNLNVCEGRCEESGDPCRFDDDCPGIDETCGTASEDCPGGYCELQLICGTDPSGNSQTFGLPCRIDYESENFGTISNDCLPAPGLNINGEGFRIDHTPTGSEQKVLPFTIPCTSTGFELFDCPCPPAGGAPTKPNGCSPACNAGPESGIGCGTGNGSGLGTTCLSGINANRLCDEDSDCPGSSCSKNPTHCVGDPAFDQFTCTSNGDCGSGTCVDACPGGRCVPLCIPEPGDPEDGICAAGPDIYSCAGAKFSHVTCTKASAESACAATCSVSATPCVSSNDCPTGERCTGSCEAARDCEAGADGILGNGDDRVGGGLCVAKERGCNLNPIVVEGGDTLNGLATPTNYLRTSIWCFGSTINSGVNATSGFGGPGVIRERGVNVVNVPAIP